MQKSMNKLYILRVCFGFLYQRNVAVIKMFLVNTKKINKYKRDLWYNNMNIKNRDCEHE